MVLFKDREIEGIRCNNEKSGSEQKDEERFVRVTTHVTV